MRLDYQLTTTSTIIIGIIIITTFSLSMKTLISDLNIFICQILKNNIISNTLVEHVASRRLIVMEVKEFVKLWNKLLISHLMPYKIHISLNITYT